MSRFRVGDVCELVNPTGARWMEKHVGLTVVILGVRDTGFGPTSIAFGDTVYALEGAPKRLEYLEERYLRLRRPPSWDTWLYTTKDVEREREGAAC